MWEVVHSSHPGTHGSPITSQSLQVKKKRHENVKLPFTADNLPPPWIETSNAATPKLLGNGTDTVAENTSVEAFWYFVLLVLYVCFFS